MKDFVFSLKMASLNNNNPNLEGNNVTICRLMNQNDANIYGNVHGGTILQMIEEAGLIAATRYCNQQKRKDEAPREEGSKIGVLVRVERTDFLQPMYVGEIAHLHSRITYCSPHSLEVKCNVMAENIMTGGRRLTNRATLWYVPRTAEGKVASVLPLTTLSVEDERLGRERYERQKAERDSEVSNNINSVLFDDWASSINNPNQNGEDHTVGSSLTTLVHFVNSTHCQMFGKVPGGFAMKLMDEAAGICAARHCHTPCVTASMDATNFHKSIDKGSIINVRARVIFTSHKSLIIQAVILVERNSTDEGGKLSLERYVGCSAFFTYVSLDSKGKTLPVPALKLTGKDEKRRYDEGEALYKRMKEMRKLSATNLQQQPAP